MKISYNWLKRYLDSDLNASEVAKVLTEVGLEVESIEQYESVKGGLEGVVIGEVLTKRPVEGSDHLSVTTVNVGAEQALTIVCGASNVAVGQRVVVATIGTTLFFGDKEVKIKKSKIRGEASEGMICAEDELGLGTSHEGIMVLDSCAKIGMPAKQYFQIETDTVFEVAITPNRIEAASHIGTARDLFAALSLQHFINEQQPQELKSKNHTTAPKFTKPDVSKFQIDNTNNPIEIIVENAEACPRYAGITISGIEVKESPAWLKNSLKAIGQKPINNVVDVTNFVLHEMGQPLHAFDADQITGKKVIVKCLPENTLFVTLDNNERKLAADDLMICNASAGMCIAGVFGGIKSGVTNDTKNIFIESAYFDPGYVRRTSKRHILNTDASFHFERGADPNIMIYALKRAAMLIKEVAGGEISSEIVDVYPKPFPNFEVEVKYQRMNYLIGKQISKDIVKHVLKSLEIEILRETEYTLLLSVPPFKVDTQVEADIVEEVLRIYGYNNIEFKNEIRSSISYSPKPNPEKIRNIASDYLSSNGFNEIMSNSLSKSLYYEHLETFPSKNLARIVNPLSSDLNIMRQTLLFGGLESISLNLNHKTRNLKLYEFGNCYFYDAEKKNLADKKPLTPYHEETHLALFTAGNKGEESWIAKEQTGNFYFLKAYVDNIFKRFGFSIDKLQTADIKNDIFDYGISYSAKTQNGVLTLVNFGLVNRSLCADKQFDIDSEVFFADINWSNLLAAYNNVVKSNEIPKYPEVRRDLALLLNKDIKFQQIKELAFQTERKILKEVSIFDVYEGKGVDANKKSYAVSFILRDEERTLNDHQIDKTIENLRKAFEEKLGAKLR